MTLHRRLRNSNLLPVEGILLAHNRMTFKNDTIVEFKFDDNYCTMDIAHQHEGDSKVALEEIKSDLDELYCRRHFFNELHKRDDLIKKKFTDKDGVLEIMLTFRC